MKFLRHLLGIAKLDKEKNQCIREKTGAQNIVLLPMAPQPGVGLGLLYNVPPGISIPCSVFPFI